MSADNTKSLRVPPKWITDEVSAIDRDLVIRWSEVSQRWIVMRKRKAGEPPSSLVSQDISERDWWEYTFVFRIENDDGSYRDLDMRLVHALRIGDCQNRDWREVLREIEKKEAAEEKARQRDIPERRAQVAQDMCDIVREKIFVGSGGTAVQQARRDKENAHG